LTSSSTSGRQARAFTRPVTNVMPAQYMLNSGIGVVGV
jgi:hypothetical protein